ncbi:MAG: 50S ribosomal protein L23 [Fibromonadaceae bacterium]|jgi:large subunit ribosomal protein L23|nr:50S ribosomal protein L23 [Fibromonadaceae bacterium]
MKEAYQILVSPHITDKTVKNNYDRRNDAYTYVFRVAKNANKFEIKKAVESFFGVQVADVNTVVVRGKIKRAQLKRKVTTGKLPNWKKAYIKLKPGQKIAEFEGMS